MKKEMGGMLQRVICEIETARGAINLNDLTRRLGVERGALDGMIQFWVRKGRLVDDQHVGVDEMSTPGSCGATCGGYSSCVFVAKVPRTYSLPPGR